MRDEGGTRDHRGPGRSRLRAAVLGSVGPTPKRSQQPPGLGSIVIARVAIGMAVIALHGLLVAALLATFIGHPGVQPGPSATLVLLTIPDERLRHRPLPPPAPPHVQPVPPHFEMIAVTPIPVALEVAGAALNASQTGSPPFERLIPEAQARNPITLREFCDRLARSERPADSGSVVLMIRVEPDGRVSDSRIEQSSGSAHLDEVALTCVSEGGVYEPRHLGIATVASWQRTHWIW